MGEFARIANGIERRESGGSVPRHCHDQPYVALVLAGGYEESGSRGRFRVGPGSVLIHKPYDAHMNRFGPGGARILNLVLQTAIPCGAAAGCVANPDAIARLAETDAPSAVTLLEKQFRETPAALEDWPDLLAADLLRDPGRSLGGWARQHGLAAETVSRGFRKTFGLTPAAFRAEARARHAFAMIAEGTIPLANIAAIAGFADQAHMSRATKTLTGQPPGYWKARSSPFKTDTRDRDNLAA